jgi:hypothetical protein
VTTGRETRMTGDGWSYGGATRDSDPSLSADGTRVATVRQPSAVFEDFDREEYVAVDVASGAIHSIVGHPSSHIPAVPLPSSLRSARTSRMSTLGTASSRRGRIYSSEQPM